MTTANQIRQGMLLVHADTQGLHDITAEITAWLDHQPIQVGLLTLFIRHTSASLLIQENVDRKVARDLETFLDKLAPEDTSLYSHIEEGPDDMPAHIKGALTQTQLSIPINEGRLLLGTYQGIFLLEHRRRPRQREIVLHAVGN